MANLKVQRDMNGGQKRKKSVVGRRKSVVFNLFEINVFFRHLWWFCVSGINKFCVSAGSHKGTKMG